MYERNILSMIHSACEMKEYEARYKKIHEIYNLTKKSNFKSKENLDDLLMNLRIRPLYLLKLITMDDFDINNMEINHYMSFIYTHNKSPVNYNQFDNIILTSVNAAHIEILTRRNFLTHRSNKVDKSYIKRAGLSKNNNIAEYLLQNNMFNNTNEAKELNGFDNLTIDINIDYFRHATMNITQLFFIMFCMTYNKVDTSLVENLLTKIINIGLIIFNNEDNNIHILEGCNLLIDYYEEYIGSNKIKSPYLIAAIVILRKKIAPSIDVDYLIKYTSSLSKDDLGNFMVNIINNDMDKAMNIMESLLNKKELDKEIIESNYIFHYICHSMEFRSLYKLHFKVNFQLPNYNKGPII